jgi:hypothetical protein
MVRRPSISGKPAQRDHWASEEVHAREGAKEAVTLFCKSYQDQIYEKTACVVRTSKWHTYILNHIRILLYMHLENKLLIY